MRILSIFQTAPSSLEPEPISFYCAGVDPGQKHDHFVIAVIQRRGQDVFLVYLKVFPLMTEYAEVKGYLKLLNERLKIRRIMVDRNGQGEVFLEDMIKMGLTNSQGVMLSLQSKQEVLGYLRMLMHEGRVHIPFDRELINELNVETYELTETGQVKFSHPSGTHDDRLWVLALAVYVSRHDPPPPYQVNIVTGSSWRPKYGLQGPYPQPRPRPRP
jgi:hypothetical protein